MSLQDDIQDNLQPVVDTSQTSEINTHSIMTSKSPDFDDASSVNDLQNFIHPPDERRRADNIASTSKVVDPNNQAVIVEQPALNQNTVLNIRQDLPESTCGLSDSFSSATDSLDEWYPFIESPPPCGILGESYRKYKRQMMKIRRNGYLLPFEISCLTFTIICCFMGAYNWPLCPADAYIPRYVFFNGASAMFSICLQIMNSLWNIVLSSHEGNMRIICAFCFGWVAIIMTLVEMTEFYTMSYSFHRYLENYCNEAFYWFVHYKNIAFGVIIVLTAMFYIPGRDIYYRLQGSNLIPIIL